MIITGLIKCLLCVTGVSLIGGIIVFIPTYLPTIRKVQASKQQQTSDFISEDAQQFT